MSFLPHWDVVPTPNNMDRNRTIIGFTGGSGAGKTTALHVLREMGGLVIDCDALYHEMLVSDAEMISGIQAGFDGVVTNGVLDRKKLGAHVFGDPEKLEKLNHITHRYIRVRVEHSIDEAAKQGMNVFGIDAVALIESGFSSFCDAVIGILAPLELRVQRIMAREGISREYALLRISAQQPDNFYYENCSHILLNGNDVEAFKVCCRELLQSIIGGKSDEPVKGYPLL